MRTLTSRHQTEASSPKYDAGCPSAVKDQRCPQFCRRSALLRGTKIGSPAARLRGGFAVPDCLNTASR